MSSIVLHHISSELLQQEWIQAFPTAQKFKVTIEPEYIEPETPTKNIWDAIQEFRASNDLDDIGDVDEIFANVRDRSPGREVDFND
jgi:hypothetical protein